MLIAVAGKALVAAKDVDKNDGPFLCLECAAHLQLKKGPLKAHHFAHRINVGCSRGYGEGETHRHLKEEICTTIAASADVSALQQERRELKQVYPDISFLLHQQERVAVEVQVTAISPSTIQRRVQIYTEQGIALLWVLPFREALIDGNTYRPTRWERYLHALYRGKLFYWSPEQKLQPVSYQDITPAGEPYRYYPEIQEWMLAGKPRRSRRYKRLHLHPQVGVLDLVAITYPAWQAGRFLSLPKARLWTLRPKPSPIARGRIAP